MQRNVSKFIITQLNVLTSCLFIAKMTHFTLDIIFNFMILLVLPYSLSVSLIIGNPLALYMFFKKKNL